MKRTIAIGDVHGVGLELEALLDKINPTADDIIICVGDLFDRALHAHNVWNAIQKYNILAVRGNHEQKMINWLEGRHGPLPPHYYVALNLLIEKTNLTPNALLNYLKSLPLLIEVNPKLIVTHAAVNINAPNQPDASINIYGAPYNTQPNNPKYFWDDYQEEQLVIYGHLVTQDQLPRVRRNTNGYVNSIGLDTAACHGGNLTAVSIDQHNNLSFCSVKCQNWAQQCKEYYHQFPKNQVPINPILYQFQQEQLQTLLKHTEI